MDGAPRSPVLLSMAPAPDPVMRAAGYAPLPWGIDLLLTDACNLRCSYCPITSDALRHRPTAFVKTERAIAFLASVAPFRPMIRMFGGEPFLHPEWPAIFAAAVSNGLPLTVVTNGTRLEGRAEELVRTGLLAIGISIDPPEVHDASRGRGTFERCASLVREIVEAKERLGSPVPQIEIYTTIHDATYALLSGWADVLDSWKIDVLRLQHQIWLRTEQRAPSEQLIEGVLGECSFFRSDVDSYCSDSMPDVDLAILARELRALECRPHPFRLEVHPPLPLEEMLDFYRDPHFRRTTARPCTLVSTYAFVDPAGRLYPCLTLDMGNVFERPFAEVWSGARFRAFRRLLFREERLPICERCPA